MARLTAAHGVGRSSWRESIGTLIRLSDVGHDVDRTPPPKGVAMLHYAVVFFVIALIAALLGFSGIAAGAVGIAKLLFVVFLVLAIGTFVFGQMRR
jgi:uncharacterized membrane protein YtjA (UPF0391 family)